jgi:AraC-like DNA-binding protein
MLCVKGGQAMELIYWLLAVISLVMSLIVLTIRGKHDIWLAAFLGFLAAYLGLIILDAQDFFISPRLYFILLSIIYLPGPILLGYIGHISSRRTVSIADFLICLLPIFIVLLAPETLSNKTLTEQAVRSDSHTESYTAFFNLISAMAGMYILTYVALSVRLLIKMRSDWDSYQSQSLPKSWYKMLQVVAVILAVALLQVASSFINISGAKASIGDISFISLVLYFIYLAVVSVRQNYQPSAEQEVIIHQLESYPDPDEELNENQEPDHEIKQLSDLIEQALSKDELFLQEDLSLNKLADWVNSTPHKLSIALNTVFGQTFYELINDFRIKYAASQLIADGNASITEVYFAAGFTTKSTFYSYFKKTYGCTPSQYRKQQTQSE